MLLNFISESHLFEHVLPAQLDDMLAAGWRHFGKQFFRYNFNYHKFKVCKVIPLRIYLASYQHSKRFRKIKRKNADFDCLIRPLNITQEKNALFDHHKYRFEDNIPNSLLDFLSADAYLPTEVHEICVYDKGKLIACSFLDMGETACSSIYGMFDLRYSAYSLGIFTMLLEIDYALSLQKTHYYHGYCYDIPSFYDYKKRFPNLEAFDWKETWKPFESLH